MKVNRDNTIQDIFLSGVIEILGEVEGNTFVQKWYGQPIEHTFLETRGILVRAGRAGFNVWLKNNIEKLGWEDPLFKLQATKRKLRTGLESICNWFSTQSGHPVLLSDEGSELRISWRKNADPRKASSLFCGDFFLGFVQEFSRWAGQGRFYLMKQIENDDQANGKCGFTLNKNPLD